MARIDVREITVPAALKSVDRVREFVNGYVSGLGLDEEQRLKVELSLYEICVNIALYAYPQEPSGEGKISVRLWREEGKLVIQVRDKGIPFNPVRKKNPDMLLRLRRGLPGGLGVYFYRTLMDGLTYRRNRGENVLTVRKTL
jgi:anti-sigma regulatory factor (Ser/Thr protein kinase)